nr:HAD-IIIC family phosphatase [Granulicella sp. dw_53]
MLGSNEHRLPSSPQSVLTHFNQAIPLAADEARVHLLDITTPAAHDGLSLWHDPALWLRAKQEVHPTAAPLYSEALAPLLAAHLGLTRKCLVLDLDNTLWGGVIGDDGLEGIHLGLGHAAGEAFLDFQGYCLRLRDRGILLAVCSKNEESTALLPFTQHPGTLLRREHFAAFFANWQDKPANLRAIAAQLNIGLDALVFADDNPFERNLVRREAPEAAVPELPEDPALFASTIARAGYFEALALTPEDVARAAQYQANAARTSQLSSATDLDSYLQSLRMQLRHRPFDEANLTRIAQLIGKTNQFNVTTRRRRADDLRHLLAKEAKEDEDIVTLQLALSDSFGDSGTIAALIARAQEHDLVIDTWLMSCRVLARRVEEATLALLVQAARQRGLTRILGELIPTPKNLPVRDLYIRLGFTPITPPKDADPNAQWFALDLSTFEEKELPFTLLEG